MATKRHSVVLPMEVSLEIQGHYIAKGASPHGAMQEALSKGARLVIEEIRGQLPAGQSPDILSGLTDEDRSNVTAFIEILKEGSVSDKRMALRQVEFWKNRKTPQSTALAAADPKEDLKKRKSSG